MKKNLNITVKGMVQGVGFRYHTLVVAMNFGINGYARNRHDGSVFIEAEGEEEQLKLFVEWCSKGPARAIVENVIVQPGLISEYKSFTIK
jgi:acylphosphatase